MIAHNRLFSKSLCLKYFLKSWYKNISLRKFEIKTCFFFALQDFETFHGVSARVFIFSETGGNWKPQHRNTEHRNTVLPTNYETFNKNISQK